MVQGTASSVGKSVLVAALCRIFRQDGCNVAPFKAQNMSLNSCVTPDGGEIGRAQVVQAEAACVQPTVDMNPILLKPEADDRSQVVVHGKPLQSLSAKSYFSLKEALWGAVTSSLDRLREDFDLVVIEGAGSPAEVNLKDKDLVNMKVASYCQAPVLLVGDIDRGGVFASLIGTLELLDAHERDLIQGFLINKFRGDISLLEPGLEWLEERTGIPVAGVIPYFKDIYIAEEDSMSLERRNGMSRKTTFLLDIAVIALRHISNFDDFDPLAQEESVRLRYVESADDLGNPDLIILPGSKSTIADLNHLHNSGMAAEILTLTGSGTPVIGICGGFQMLGDSIYDPEQVESRQQTCAGLGLLPLSTTFGADKSTHLVKGEVLLGKGLLRGAQGLSLSGYEIHMGRTDLPEAFAPFRINQRSRDACSSLDGCLSAEGNILGTYVHGIFSNTRLRRALLAELGRRKPVDLPPPGQVISKEEEYDKLAELVRQALDMKLIYKRIGL
ncbi:MAG: cobyric acid synthase [Acidobacteriota bacterium]